MKKTIGISTELTRAAMLTEETVGDKKAKRVSISSDVPYRRYDWMNDEDYYEVLSHDEADIDTTRLKQGLPVLFNHNRDSHLGRSTTYNNSGHRMDVGTTDDIIWSGGEDAQTKKQDVESGALVGTSVGYRILDDGVCVGEKDGIPIYKFKWGPHEFSFCTIEADTTVGAGRELTREAIKKAKEDGVKLPALKEIVVECKSNVDNQGALTKSEATHAHIMPETSPATQPAATIQTSTAHNDDVAAFKGRCRQINDFVKRTEKQPEWHKLVAQIAEKHLNGDADFGAFSTEANEAHPGFKHVETQAAPVGMNEKEIKSFSFLRAIHSLGTGRGLQGLEKEASDAHGKAIGHDCGPHSFFVPLDVQRGSAFPRGITPEQVRTIADGIANLQTRALFTNVYSGAGAFVGTELLGGSLIELLRNQMFVVALGARSLSGLTGNVAIPRQTGGATASWLAEDSTITATQQVVGQLNMTPHKLAAATAFTEQFALQTSVDAENFVRQDLTAVSAIARDLAAIAGTGVSGQPVGILNLGSANLSTPVTLSAAQSMTYANAVKFELNVSLNNANRGKLGYLVSPTVKNNAKLIAEISSTNSNPVWKDNMVNGYPAVATNQIPTATSVIFGNWDDLILADWAQSNFFVDPYSLSMQGQIRVINRLYCDNGVRHGTSFSVSTN